MRGGEKETAEIVCEKACGACCTRLANFSVKIGRRLILDNINLHLHCGEMVALIGLNGAGKTTLLRAIMGEVPHRGELRFIPFKAGQRAPLVGYVPQKLEIDSSSPVTVLDLFCGALSFRPLLLGYGKNCRPQAQKALALVGAEELIQERIGALSGGQLQRVLLALALTPLPDILLLDEPLTGVDKAGIERFYETLANLRRTYDLSILLVSHDLLAVGAVADRMLFLHQGRIECEGTPREVLQNSWVRTVLGFERETVGRLPLPKAKPDLHMARNDEVAG